MADRDRYRLFGVRHHGPGSARSLLSALEAYRPDAILIEGPPDADELLAHVAHEELVPPVALLVYPGDTPERAVFYPFADFSPEWQALRFAARSGTPVRFFDLPQLHALAIEAAKRAEAEAPMEPPAEPAESDAAAIAPEPELECKHHHITEAAWRDLARAAGLDDPELLWERLVEQRQDTTQVFDAVAELMSALRESIPHDTRDALREAWMRRELRAELKEGRERIAVVCGAMHVPALDKLGPAKADNDLLKGLPKLKTAATWVPWTDQRLAFESGYGAGVTSPGWYRHLWSDAAAPVENWMSRAARAFREQDLDVGPAHSIESTRLAHALAALRGRRAIHLGDVMDAIEMVFCAGDPRPLALVREKLVIGTALGKVPAELPRAPLAADLAREQKRLRLPPEASAKTLELDLRKPFDLERSVLLHRLDALGIEWGRKATREMGKGTFRETWELRWDPGFEPTLIERSRFGSRIADAAARYLVDRGEAIDELPKLASLLDLALLADLGAAIAPLAQQLDALAVASADVVQLMGALARLAGLLRYKDVRGTDAGPVAHMVHNYLKRICVGLVFATSNIQDEAAETLSTRLDDVDQALRVIDEEALTEDWISALSRVSLAGAAHPRCAGRATRQFSDRGRIDAEELAKRLSRALSPAVAADQAAWLEGFLGASGLVLVHQPALLGLIDDWLVALSPEVFQELLPVLRRAVARFEAPERRQIGERIRSSEGVIKAAPASSEWDVDWQRALPALATLRKLYGLPEATP